MWEEAAPAGLALRRGPVRFVEEAASSPEVAVDVGPAATAIAGA